ncbi:MAG: hypothetical protein ACFFD2_07135 [Promethearchaeota archaeon]
MTEDKSNYIPFTEPAVPPEQKKKEKEVKRKKEKKEKKPPEKPMKFGHKDIKTYTWQMENFQIMLADSQSVLVALMLDSSPSEPITEALLKFTSLFEDKFKTEIESFRGNVSWFRSAAEIADDSFNMFLMRPQCLPLTEKALKCIRLTDVEARVVKIAQHISKDTGYFFLATLLDEVLKRFKISKERALRSFFTLHNKKAFIPIHIEEVKNEVEKRQMWQLASCIDGITSEECDLLMGDLLLSTVESRETLIAQILEFKKKTRGNQLREEIEKRKRLRKERNECFKKVDEFLRANDFNKVVNTFDQIINLSWDLGEASVAQELSNRARVYRDELHQMRNRIPMLRNQRNDALNQAELLELNGKYEEAAQQFQLASNLSAEIGEIDKSKDYLDQTQRLLSLAELKKLRERLK